MKITLWSKDGAVRLMFAPSPSDRCHERLMGESYLALSFTTSEYTPLEVGDYAEFEGERYHLLEGYTPEMVSTLEYRYTLRLYPFAGFLRHTKVLKPAESTPELDFALDARAHEHIQLIVDNMNRTTGGTLWKVGTVIASDSRNIEYRNRYCLEALADIAKAFEAEYWIEGRTINLARCEHGTPIPLAYRYGLATGISRLPNTTARHFTRLYPLGSKRNITPSTYGRSRLSLPEGRAYLERNTHLGTIEQSEEAAFAHIYPRYTGSVTSVRHEERKAEDGTAYSVYFFSDSGLPFDPSLMMLPALTLHIVFTSGELNGRDFEANYHPTTREWELIAQRPYGNQFIPSGRLVPQRGDSYIPYNMRMPEEYIRRAERELEEEAQRYLERISRDTSVYKAHTDYIYLSNEGINLRLGQRIRLEDPQLFAHTEGRHESRITAISRSVLLPTDMDIELTHAVDVGRVAQLEGGIQDLRAAYQETRSSLPSILSSWDSADPTEYNVLSALRTLGTIARTALRKDQDDYTAHAIGSAEHLEGVLGWLIRPTGDAFFKNLRIAGSLDVEELRRNKVTVLSGDHYYSSGSAIIDSLAVEDDMPYFTIRSEEGEGSSLDSGDYCIGKWATATGVAVCRIQINTIDSEGRHWYYHDPTSAEPLVGMHLAQVGHPSDSRRQRATIVRGNLIIQYAGLDRWDIEPHHITALLGDLEGASLEPWGKLSGSGVAIKNAYLSGRLAIQSEDGRSAKRMPYDKGVWRHSIAYPHDEFEYNGHRWLWTGLTPTSSYPSVENGWTDLGATIEEAISEATSSFRYLRRAFRQSTDISGGVVLSQIVGVRNNLGEIAAYINGLARGTDPMLALGVRDAFTSQEERNFAVDQEGNVYLGQMRARSRDGSLLCFPRGGSDAPYLVLGGGAVDLAALLRANPNKYGFNCYGRRMSWRGSGQSISGSGRGGNAQFISRPFVPSATSARIKANIQLKAGAREVSSYRAVIALSVNVYLVRGDNARLIGSRLLEASTSGRVDTATLTIDKTELNLTAGEAYSLRIECNAVSFAGETLASVDIIHLSVAGEPIYGAEAVAIGEEGCSVMYALDKMLIISKDEDEPFLRLYGKTDTPGILAAGRVARDGQLLAAWGAKVNRSGRSTPEVVKNPDNTYTVHHSVGHSRYIPMLTTEDSRDVANYFEIRDNYFKVRLTLPNENRSAYPNAFSYTILGDNNPLGG